MARKKQILCASSLSKRRRLLREKADSTQRPEQNFRRSSGKVASLMEALVNAVSEFLAAIFARFGYIGRTRRRAHIREDLVLLEEIRGSDAYGTQSQTASYLHDHINREVADYSGITLKHKRKVPWGTVVLSIPIGLGFAYWTYKIVEDGFSLFSLLTGAVAAFFLIGGLGVLFTGGDSEEQEDGDNPVGAS